MFRGLLILVVTLAGLIFTMVCVVSAGMNRIKAANKALEASYQPAPPAAPQTQPAPVIPVVEVEKSEEPQFVSIELWAHDGDRHGNPNLQLTERGSGRAYRKPDPRRDVRGQAKWERNRAMATPPPTEITGFHNSKDVVTWPVEIPKAGEYEVDVTYGCQTWQAGGHFLIKIGDQQLQFTTEGARAESIYRSKVTLADGKAEVVFCPGVNTRPDHLAMSLRSIKIVPVP